jgi:hypothetical protein
MRNAAHADLANVPPCPFNSLFLPTRSCTASLAKVPGMKHVMIIVLLRSNVSQGHPDIGEPLVNLWNLEGLLVSDFAHEARYDDRCEGVTLVLDDHRGSRLRPNRLIRANEAAHRRGCAAYSETCAAIDESWVGGKTLPMDRDLGMQLIIQHWFTTFASPSSINVSQGLLDAVRVHLVYRESRSDSLCQPDSHCPFAFGQECTS